MPIKTVTASQAAEKWIRRSQTATPDYQAGVQNPSVDWAQATKAAEPNYKTAVIAAANAGKFGRGVTAAGTPAWQSATLDKGAQRWAPGIAGAEAQFAQGIGGVLQTVGALTLPPRGVKGDPRNLERVRIVAEALHKKAVSS